MQGEALGFRLCGTGRSGTPLHNRIDIGADAFKVLIHCIVGNSQNKQVVIFKKGTSDGIINLFALLIVLRTVQLHHQFGLGAVKISNIVPQYFLTIEANRILTKKVIPQMPFFFRHFFSQLSGKGDKTAVIFSLHGRQALRPFGAPPLRQGEAWSDLRSANDQIPRSKRSWRTRYSSRSMRPIFSQSSSCLRRWALSRWK